MPRPLIFGGITLENVAKDDQWWGRQLELLAAGAIDGIQLRVGHPGLTPLLATTGLPEILGRIPKEVPVFIHFGAESVGVDLGQHLDERSPREFCSIWANTNLFWAMHNRQVFEWGHTVAKALGDRFVSQECVGVTHPGYALRQDEELSYWLIDTALDKYVGSEVALETVPAIAIPEHGSCLWGVGGTPQDMCDLLDRHPGSKCLLDLTHMLVTASQVEAMLQDPPPQWSSLGHGIDPDWANPETLVNAYLDFVGTRLCDVCHFSGIPDDSLVDTHSSVWTPESPDLHDLLGSIFRTMRAICLEINFGGDFQKVAAFIDEFKQTYELV